MNLVQQDCDRDIVVVDAVDLCADISGAIAATRDFAPAFETSADLTPFDEDSGRAERYRAELLTAAPQVAALAADVSGRLARGDMAVVAPSLGLEGRPLDQQRFVLFALSNLLGAPTATEPRNRRVLWDVKPRAVASGHFATFSEHSDEAELHTDNAFSADPESSFFLYVVQEARCGGGMSYFSNGRRIRDRLARTSPGRDAIDLLGRARVPFRVPSAFSHDPNVPEYTTAAVFGERPQIRFRQDVILRALDANPAAGASDIRDAVNLVADAARSVQTSDLKLPTGGIAFVDNHNALHGRTRFSDAGRHLIRVRVADRVTGG